MAAAALFKWVQGAVGGNNVDAPAQAEADEQKPTRCAHALEEPKATQTSNAHSMICKGDITEIKSLAQPPQAVKKVLECVLILLRPDLEEGGWAAAKSMMGDANFLRKLLKFNFGQVTERQVEKVRVLLGGDEIFEGERIKTVSVAVYGLLGWRRFVSCSVATRSSRGRGSRRCRWPSTGYSSGCGPPRALRASSPRQRRRRRRTGRSARPALE